MSRIADRLGDLISRGLPAAPALLPSATVSVTELLATVRRSRNFRPRSRSRIRICAPSEAAHVPTHDAPIILPSSPSSLTRLPIKGGDSGVSSRLAQCRLSRRLVGKSERSSLAGSQKTHTCAPSSERLRDPCRASLRTSNARNGPQRRAFLPQELASQQDRFC
jgi:hypothetical protein